MRITIYYTTVDGTETEVDDDIEESELLQVARKAMWNNGGASGEITEIVNEDTGETIWEE